MNYIVVKRIYDRIVDLSSIYENFINVIEKRGKKEIDFIHAFEIGSSLYRQSYKIFKRLKNIVYRNKCTTLQQAEMHELYYLFKSYKKVVRKLDKKFNKNYFIFRKIHDDMESKLIIERNSIFVFIVNFISRNFLNISLPSEFNVDKFINDANKVSLSVMLNMTDWSQYFTDEKVRDEMINFSSSLFSTNWWNHSKYYRNVFVHRISLETYYSKNYKNMNTRIKTYLPVLCYLGIKYYLYNLLNESVIEKEQKQNKLSNWLKSKKNKES